jgi:hypothetical protein
MKATVRANMGDVFEGGADLTVLPCGAKPTWTASVERWIEQFDLPTPKDLVEQIRLSEVTSTSPFPGPQRITRFIAYAASVSNDQTSADAIMKIGQNIGAKTKLNPEIRIVESVLFGTGHGRLDDVTAARALAKGFRNEADSGATLWIHVQSHDRFLTVQKALTAGFWRQLWNSLQLSPSFFGIGINLKKLFGCER